jgi:hypothetical protein
MHVVMASTVLCCAHCCLQDVSSEVIAGVQTYTATPKGYSSNSSSNSRLLVYLHGGAYIKGSCDKLWQVGPPNTLRPCFSHLSINQKNGRGSACCSRNPPHSSLAEHTRPPRAVALPSSALLSQAPPQLLDYLLSSNDWMLHCDSMIG